MTTMSSAASQTTSQADDAPTSRRVLRRPLVEQRTGFKRAHIYSLMKEKKFPQRVRLGVRAVGWYEDEIDQWLAQRERA
ncbi:AlpA family transcriptional regulator [Paracidovorax citrulli]